MKLSIIIPIYNEEPFLNRCLDSVLKARESVSEVEIIAIDDGSTDGSLDILQAYKDDILVICRSKNAGVSSSRNDGINCALGEYVTFLDSDDEMSEEGISEMLAVIEHRGEPIIQFNHYRFRDSGFTRFHQFNNTDGIYTLKHGLPSKYAVVWNKAYRRAFLDEHNIRFNEGQQFDEDRQFNLQCLNYSKSIYCSERFVTKKRFDNNKSICHTLDREKLLKASDSLVDMLRSGDLSPELEETIRKAMVSHWDSKHYKKEFGGDI